MLLFHKRVERMQVLTGDLFVFPTGVKHNLSLVDEAIPKEIRLFNCAFNLGRFEKAHEYVLLKGVVAYGEAPRRGDEEQEA